MAERFPFALRRSILGWDAAGRGREGRPRGDVVQARRRGLRLLPAPPPAVRHLRASSRSVPEGFLAHKPRSLSFEEAAARAAGRADRAPGARRARAARRRDAARRRRRRAGSGTSPIQLGVVRGARVIATASEPANHDFMRELGAEPLDYHAGDVADAHARRGRRRRRRRGARPVRRRRPRAGLRRAAPRRPAGLARRSRRPSRATATRATTSSCARAGDRALRAGQPDRRGAPEAARSRRSSRSSAPPTRRRRSRSGHVRGKLVLRVRLTREHQRGDRGRQRARSAAPSSTIEALARVRAARARRCSASEPAVVGGGQVDGEHDRQRAPPKHDQARSPPGASAPGRRRPPSAAREPDHAQRVAVVGAAGARPAGRHRGDHADLGERQELRDDQAPAASTSTASRTPGTHGRDTAWNPRGRCSDGAGPPAIFSRRPRGDPALGTPRGPRFCFDGDPRDIATGLGPTSAAACGPERARFFARSSGKRDEDRRRRETSHAAQVHAREDPEHRDHGPHRRGQDHDDRAHPLLHRPHPQDG